MPFGAGQGGRPRGARNRSTKDLKAILDRLAGGTKQDLHAKRLHALTQSADEQVAVKALAVVLAYRYGKPKESVELTLPEPVLVRYVDA